MNPQMQQYRHGAYAQGQPRGAPAARRPGECDSSTNATYYTHGSSMNRALSHLIHNPAIPAGGRAAGPTCPACLLANMFVNPVPPDMRQPDAIANAYVHTAHSHLQSHPQLQLMMMRPPPQARLRMQLHSQLQPSSHFQTGRTPQSRLSFPCSFHPATRPTLPSTHRRNAQRLMYLQRRPGGPMPPNTGYPHPNPAAAAAQHAHAQQMQNATAQQRHALLEHQSAQRRAKKPTDKTLPDGIDELLVTPSIAQQYRDLRDAERRLDYSMMRKRTDLHDAYINRTIKRQKTMRVWISNTAENQPWQGSELDENPFDFTSGSDPTIRVKIEGRLLEDPEEDVFASDDENDTEENEGRKSTKKFTHFFKSLNVEFDRARQGGMDASMQVDWKKPANFTDVDELAFSRRGDENMNITINLVRDENPERFRLSHALAQTLDMEEADRAETVMGLWEYVKVMGLQEDDEKRHIQCDDSLRQIFGRDKVFFPSIPELIMPHFHPLPLIKLPYTIRVDQTYLNNPEPTVYDIRVSVDDPMRAKVAAMMQNPEQGAQLRQIGRLDDELAVVVQAIQHSKSKHSFYKQMSRDPIGFVNKWMSSQQRDLEVILGEAARGGGEDGMGIEFARGGEDGVWGSNLTREAVRYLLAKNVVVKT